MRRLISGFVSRRGLVRAHSSLFSRRYAAAFSTDALEGQGRVISVSSKPRSKDVVLVRSNEGSYQLGDTLVSGTDWGIRGHVFYAYEGSAWVQMQEGAELLQPGDVLIKAEEVESVPAGDAMLGLTFDHKGRALDLAASAEQKAAVHLQAWDPTACLQQQLSPTYPDVYERARITTPLHTGVTAIDALVPTGIGQSLLLYGPRGIDVQDTALQVLAAQSKGEMRCVYVALDKTTKQLQAIQAELRQLGADQSVAVVTSLKDEGHVAIMQAVTTGCAIADCFRNEGKDSLLIFDDFADHLKAFSTLSADLESDPLHPTVMLAIRRVLYAGILQRCARLVDGGSMTALALLRTPDAEPTEFISIADGHLSFSPELFHEGQRPAIDLKVSVSRTGARARSAALTKVARTLKMDLLDGLSTASFTKSQKKSSEKESTNVSWTDRTMQVLQQSRYEGKLLEEEVVLLLMVTEDLARHVPIKDVLSKENGLMQFLREQCSDALSEIEQTGDVSPVSLTSIKSGISAFEASWQK